MAWGFTPIPQPAFCLEIMDLVNRERKEYVITKRGIPVAKLIPITEPLASPFGYLKETVLFMEDIVSPLDLHWSIDEKKDKGGGDNFL